jgi:diacylglycerol kinase family enzyme
VGGFTPHLLSKDFILYNFNEKIYLSASKEKLEIYSDLVKELKNNSNCGSIDCIDESSKGLIVVLGGDGSLNYLVNKVENISRFNIVYFPCGTANDFARSVRLKSIQPSWASLKDIVDSATLIKIPIMYCNQKKFINVATVGAPAKVTQSGSDNLKEYAGRFSYYINAIEKAISPEVIDVKINVDNNKEFEEKLYGFGILQGLYAGGGVKLSPSIVPNFQSSFEMTGIKNSQLVNGLNALIKFQVEQTPSKEVDESVIYERAELIKVNSVKEIPVKLDGEEFLSDELIFKKSDDYLNLFYY